MSHESLPVGHGRARTYFCTQMYKIQNGAYLYESCLVRVPSNRVRSRPYSGEHFTLGASRSLSKPRKCSRLYHYSKTKDVKYEVIAPMRYCNSQKTQSFQLLIFTAGAVSRHACDIICQRFIGKSKTVPNTLYTFRRKKTCQLSKIEGKNQKHLVFQIKDRANMDEEKKTLRVKKTLTRQGKGDMI